MSRTAYRFDERWLIDAPRDAVYAVLIDLPAYPEWWPQVRRVERIDDDHGRIECRSVLPYTLRFDVHRSREDKEAGVLEARLVGDLNGWSRWTIIASGGATELVYEQEVATSRPLLRWTALIARPVMVWNHAWMMRSGRRGLEARLAGGD